MFESLNIHPFQSLLGFKGSLLGFRKEPDFRWCVITKAISIQAVRNSSLATEIPSEPLLDLYSLMHT
jgi:hypothetical protein